ncbi:hypothetical protein FACS189452_04170 [Bacteroidia bacterium]|nr:hypothetical protein FACS189452_04170 [Bacteroidia bacterium]
MDVYRTYDSVDFVVQSWPVIEAYKKYVGQTFFLLATKLTKSTYYTNNMLADNKPISTKKPILLSNELKKDKYQSYKKGKMEELINKYYKIVDIVNYLDDAGKPKARFSGMVQPGHRVYKYPCKDDENKTCESPSDVPCFVLVEQASGDTCYTVFPENFILVGAFTKVQKHFEQAKLNYIKRSNNKSTVESWQCIKVAVASHDFHDYPQYEGLSSVSLIVQNEKGVQKAVPVKEYVNMKWWLMDAPVLVSDILAQKKFAEEDQKCCTELVKELEKKYSASQEMKSTETTAVTATEVKPKKSQPQRIRVRRN